MADRAELDWTKALAGRAERMGASEIRELLKLLDQPGIVSFAGGIPDPALFPTQAIADSAAALLADPASSAGALQYTASEGHRGLREWIVAAMGRMGVPCTLDNVVVTGGSQQGLDFLGKLLIGPGDTMLVTSPTYLGALQAFNPYEPRYDRLDLEGNMTPAGYRESAGAGRIAAAYVVPDFANPTGESMPEATRIALLDLCAGLDIPLIEDAAYTALRFEGEAIPSCMALDVARQGGIEASRVVYCGTFSKTVAPGLRVGWICAASALVHKVVLAKQAADLHSSSLSQAILHRVVADGYDAQLRRVVDTYAERRTAMVGALARHMPANVRWTEPHGGMFVWVTLPEGMDGAALLARAIEEEKIAFVPGAAFHADGTGRNTIRLSYSLQPEAVVDDAMARLAGLIARMGDGGGR
ncbi:MAG: PLP-dependent aminotransferase family protein [Microvirga sp.]